MKKTIRLVTRVDAVSGELGLVNKELSNLEMPMVDYDGYQIAHDICEHVNGIKSIGTIEDELEALAGIWWTRGQWGQLRRDRLGSAHSPEENIAWDVTNLFREWSMRGYRPLKYKQTRDIGFDDQFEYILEKGIESIHGELDDEEIDEAEKHFEEYREACIRLFRSGTNKFYRRWDGIAGRHNRYYQDSGLMANEVFWGIQEALKEAKDHIEYEGQEFKLHIDFDSARLEGVYEEVYW